MTERKYPEEMSEVVVTFVDGEVKTYTISASPRIAQYLAREAGETGVLSLLNGDVSYGLPLVQIRDWQISTLKGKSNAT